MDQNIESPKSGKSRFQSVENYIFLGTGVLMVLYHLVTTQVAVFGNFEHQNFHLAFSLVLVFLGTGLSSKGKLVKSISWVMIMASLFFTGYVFFFMEHIEMSVGMPEVFDMFVGTVIILLVIEATRQAWGITLPIVVLIFILYMLFGHHLAGALYHRPFSLDYVISYLSIGLTGVYGTFLAISANQVFLFVVFGAVLGAIGITDCLYEIGKFVGRYSRGGPGHTAVVSSSLIGMVTGAAVANVAITGSFSIPYMKSVGYKPEIAGGIEATASTGGQLMPPIMGAAAFLMAFFIGVPYVDIMIAGFLPAVLFYVGVFASVQFLSVAEGIESPTEKVDTQLIFRRIPLFLIPLAVIVALLMMHYSPMISAFYAILIAVSLSFVSKETRPTVMDLLHFFTKGALVGAKICVSLAVVGMMAQVLITTGLGTKIASLVELLSGGNMLIALTITMIVSIILGCGCPPSAAYSLVALVVAPTLVRMGIEPLRAHFFCFYFAVISAVTPPVALGALAGAGIAEANYFRTAYHAFKISIAGFIIPYLIIYNPVLTLQLKGLAASKAVGTFVAAPFLIVLLAAVIYRAAIHKMDWVTWLISFAAFSFLLSYTAFYTNSFILFLVGLLVGTLALWLSKSKKGQVAASEIVQNVNA